MLALTRAVSPRFAACELSHLARVPIDLARARRQHLAYQRMLERHGWTVIELPESEVHPDCVFVEDTAVVLDELAIVTRPGVESRRGEVEAVALALAPLRPLAWIEAPATLDGGDVLRLGRRLFVGMSARSSAAGIRALAALAEPRGYDVVVVELRTCLHLKTAVSAAGQELVVANPDWVDLEPFRGLDIVEVDAQEPFAANVLDLGEVVVAAAAFARTNDRLAARGVRLEVIEVDELAKAEGGLTCCSVLVRSGLAC